MVGTVELYILILVLVALTLILGHRGVKRQSFHASYFTKFIIDTDGIRDAFMTCLSDELHACFFLIRSIF